MMHGATFALPSHLWSTNWAIAERKKNHSVCITVHCIGICAGGQLFVYVSKCPFLRRRHNFLQELFKLFKYHCRQVRSKKLLETQLNSKKSVCCISTITIYYTSQVHLFLFTIIVNPCIFPLNAKHQNQSCMRLLCAKCIDYEVEKAEVVFLDSSLFCMVCSYSIASDQRTISRSIQSKSKSNLLWSSSHFKLNAKLWMNRKATKWIITRFFLHNKTMYGFKN